MALPGFEDLEVPEGLGVTEPALPGFEGVHVPFSARDVTELPTISSLRELPQDLIDRTILHGKAGARSLIEGLLSVVPGTEETIWRGPQPDESTLQFALSKLRPLGIVGGPLEMVASPITAGVSELARGGQALERRVRSSDTAPIMETVEEWAPVLSTLILGNIGPARRGAARFLFGPGQESPAEYGKRVMQRVSQGYQSTEGGLKSLARVAPTARELGAEIRTGQAFQQRTSGLMHRTIEPELSKLTPAQADEFYRLYDPELFGLPAGEAAIPTHLQPYERAHERLFGTTGVRSQLAQATGLRGKTPTGEDIPFTPRPGRYVPRVFDPEVSADIRQIHDFERAVLGKPVTVKRGVAMGEERSIMANAAYARTSETFAQSAIKDLPTAVRQSIEEFSRTLGQARAFGPQNERLNDMVRRISEEIGGPGGVHVAKSVYDAIKRDFGPGAAKNTALDSLRVFQAATKMPLSFVSNATQSFITAVVAGARSTTQAVFDVLYDAATKRELPKIVRELGIINKTMAKEVQHEIGGGAPAFLRKAGETILKPFEWVERFNQTVAARAGELATQRLSDKLLRSRSLSPREWRWLANSDLDVAAIRNRVATSGGGLTHAEVQRSAWGLLDRTQFLARPTAMPYAMRKDPLMRLVFQMKTFAARNTSAIWNEVWKEARQGNFNPMARVIAYYPIGGELARQVGGTLRGREIEEFTPEVQALIQRGLYNTLFVGGLGVASDAAISMTKGTKAGLGYMVGPGLTDIAQEGTEFFNLAKHYIEGEPEKHAAAQQRLARAWARRIPFIGPRIGEALKTPQQVSQTKPY